MPVVQLTVQVVGGIEEPWGRRRPRVQFTRSIGAALGTAAVGAVLFGALAVRDPAMVELFAQVVERGPKVLEGVPAETRAALGVEIAEAFRAAFLMIGCFSLGAWVLAWTLPVRRI